MKRSKDIEDSPLSTPVFKRPKETEDHSSIISITKGLMLKII